MRKTKFQRVTAFALALVFLLCAGLVPVSADDSSGNGEGSASEIKELLNAISYNDYIAIYSNAQDKENFVPVANGTITVPGKDGVVSSNIDLGKLTDEQREKLTEDQLKNYAYVETAGAFGGEKDVLYTPGLGEITWTLDPSLPQYAALQNAGRYCIEIDYYPVANKSTSIERLFMVNDKVPFLEARYLTISKVWRNAYDNASFEVPKGEDAQKYLDTAAAVGIDGIRPGRRYLRRIHHRDR